MGGATTQCLQRRRQYRSLCPACRSALVLGWPLRRTVVVGFVVSFGIELLQLAIPGRTTATVDVLCNTLGAAVGWLVAASLARRRA